jgi:protein O-GlcNAc transferase
MGRDTSADADSLLARARGHFAAGRIGEAERLLRQTLKVDAENAEALAALGSFAQRRGDSRTAVDLLRRAIQRDPENAEHHRLLAEAHRSLGHAGAAAIAAREAVRLAPGSAPARNALGLALQEEGDGAEAESQFLEALRLDPDYPAATYNLGNVLRGAGRLVEAEDKLRRALLLRPRYPQALNALGVVLGELDRHAEASTAFHRALALAPNDPKPHYNLGNLLAKVERPADAVTCYDNALRLRREYPEALVARASMLVRLGRGEEAGTDLRRAAKLAPQRAALQLNIGSTYLAAHRYQEAEFAFQRALDLDPALVEARAGRERARAEQCDWRQRESDVRDLLGANRRALAAGKPSSLTPSMGLYFPVSPEESLEFARSTAAGIARHAGLPAAGAPRPTVATTPRQRLRLGYLSSDFRNHALAHLARQLFPLHDRSRFEVFAYSVGPDDHSEYRRGIARDCDRFVDLETATSPEAAARIRADDVAILIDLSGFAAGARPQILAHRVAPIQITYLYPTSLGGLFTDYLIGDSVATPVEHQSHFGERLVLLPGSFQIADHRQPIAERRFEREECGLPTAGFVFSSFNAQWKIEPTVFAVWMRILVAVPGSVLWLLDATPQGRENLRREAEQRGVAGSRLVFAPTRPKPEHLSRLRLADLGLDPWICNGHTTTNDALWSGVPVITCPGRQLAQRVAASLLHAAGVPELVVPDLDSYERLAVRLATSPDSPRVARPAPCSTHPGKCAISSAPTRRCGHESRRDCHPRHC